MQRKPHLTGSLSSSFSFINGIQAPVNSLTGAVSFAGKFRIGIGYNWLSLPTYNREAPLKNAAIFFHTEYKADEAGRVDTFVNKLSLKYISYYTDYTFFETRHWECAVKFQVGMGKAGYHPLTSKTIFGKDDHVFFVYEPSTSLEYHFFKWLGLGMQFGFRFTIAKEEWLLRNFNSPTYDLGIQIYYDQLYKLLFPHTKLAKQL